MAIIYAAAGWLGLNAAFPGSNITLIWPAAGWSLAVLLVWGRRYWPGIWIGAFALEATINPVWVAAGMAIGNTLAPLLGAWGLDRLGFRYALPHRRDAGQFLVVGVLVAMLISAANGGLWLALGGIIAWPEYPKAAFRWWLGDAAGVLVFAPVFYPILRAARPNLGAANIATFLAVIALNTEAASVSFLQMTDVSGRALPTAFLPLVSLTLTAIAYRSWVVSVSVLAVSAVALYGTAHGTSCFSGYTALESAGLLWAFFAAIGISTLVISALLGEQHAARAALGRREAQYRALVEDNPAMIVRFGADGRLTFANEAFCRFHELTPEAARGRDVFGLIRGPEAEAFRADARRILGGRGPYAILTHVTDSRGDECWIDWKAHLIEGGEFQAVGLDVTGRQVAERERRRLEQQVFQTQKWQSLGLIAGGLAHDFNNLLMGVLGHADLAAALLPAHSAGGKHLAEIAESARRLAELNGQLLAFAGKGKLLDGRVDLNRTIARAVEGIREAQAVAYRIELELDGDLPGVMGDENQLAQAVRNLVMNALEARRSPKDFLTIRTRSIRIEAGDYALGAAGGSVGTAVRIDFADTGAGIEPGVLDRIFEPFFTTKALGRGLGLPAVQGIATAHGGAVLAESETGRGTTVRVILPAMVALETVPETELPEIAPTPVDSRRSVLIIDDEESVRMLVVLMLQKFGWEVLSADSGRKGIEGFQGNADRIAFVVLDMMMPEMDGLAVRGALREIRPDIPILYCTGYSTEAIDTDEASGPSGLLLKPFSLGDLEKAIANLLGRSSPAGVG